MRKHNLNNTKYHISVKFKTHVLFISTFQYKLLPCNILRNLKANSGEPNDRNDYDKFEIAVSANIKRSRFDLSTFVLILIN